jgi:hypothetical protein
MYQLFNGVDSSRAQRSHSSQLDRIRAIRAETHADGINRAVHDENMYPRIRRIYTVARHRTRYPRVRTRTTDRYDIRIRAAKAHILVALSQQPACNAASQPDEGCGGNLHGAALCLAYCVAWNSNNYINQQPYAFETGFSPVF